MGLFGLFGNKENGPTKEEMGVDTSYSQSAEQPSVAEAEAAINLVQQEGGSYNDALTQVKDQNQVNHMMEAGVPTSQINQSLESKGYEIEGTSPEGNPVSQNMSSIEHAPASENLTQESVAQEMAAGGINIISENSQSAPESEVANNPLQTEAAASIEQPAPEVSPQPEQVIADPSNLEQSISQEPTIEPSQPEEPVA